MESNFFESFKAELRSSGYSDAVDRFERAEKDVERQMGDFRKRSQRMIEAANLAQKVNDTVKERRYIYYESANGKRIVH